MALNDCFVNPAVSGSMFGSGGGRPARGYTAFSLLRIF